jgi:glycerate-2-kinase
MAQGLMDVIHGWLPVKGWVNVPEGTESPIQSIVIHPARPMGRNEPTEQGVFGAQQILDLVADAGPRDLCVTLLSGGGSALLPLPRQGISLHEKLEATQFLSAAGANITELNTVRKHLSRIKGGGLLRACRAGALVTLVLSDVLGDPLDVIASGPTVPDPTEPEQALSVLRKYDSGHQLSDCIYRCLDDAILRRSTETSSIGSSRVSLCPHAHFVIGNNAMAVDEAGIRAEQLGYNHVMHCATSCEGPAEEVGQRLASMTLHMLKNHSASHRHDCLITGGEPTVKLASSAIRGTGGRNQQLVLAAYKWLRDEGLPDDLWSRLCILAGGTDGEDGPTDVAGAWLDEQIHHRAMEMNLDVGDFLRRCDSYDFFRRVGGLLKTGPTGTNVCDLRVVVVRPEM